MTAQSINTVSDTGHQRSILSHNGRTAAVVQLTQSSNKKIMLIGLIIIISKHQSTIDP